MRSATDAAKVRKLMQELGRAARGPGNIYLTGGTTAVLFGWRDATVDVDLKLDPEPPGVFEALARLKDELEINVELAAPDHFIPPIPGWRERSLLIEVDGSVSFFHYDLLTQALAKVERGHAQDLDDVHAMLKRGLVELDRLAASFIEIEPDLIRYPALDADVFRGRLATFVDAARRTPGSP